MLVGLFCATQLIFILSDSQTSPLVLFYSDIYLSPILSFSDLLPELPPAVSPLPPALSLPESPCCSINKLWM